VAPSDIWTKRLKTIIVPIATGRTVMRENSISAQPSTTRAMNSHLTRPRRPQREPNLSPMIPPVVRAKMFIKPKRPATRPAFATLSSKSWWK